MIDVIFWIVIGALSGWIGYLGTRTAEGDHILRYLMVGIIGGFLGGVATNSLGLSESVQGISVDSIFNALITSALFIVVFVVFLNFFGNTSSS